MAGVTIKIVLVSGSIEFRVGLASATGDIVANRKDKITFECDQPFALFIKNFVPAISIGASRPFVVRSPIGRSESPFDRHVFASNPSGMIPLKVKALAKLGQYQYGLAVLDASGHIVTLDPRIIID